MDIKIREAEKNDYEQIEKIMQQVQNLHVQWRPDIYKSVETVLAKERFLEHLENGEALAAESEGKVVGILIYKTRLVSGGPVAERKVMYIDSMGVEEQSRGKGVGKKLFEYVKGIYERDGFNGMELSVNAKNTGAKRFYEKCGFTEKKIIMEFK